MSQNSPNAVANRWILWHIYRPEQIHPKHPMRLTMPAFIHPKVEKPRERAQPHRVECHFHAEVRHGPRFCNRSAHNLRIAETQSDPDQKKIVEKTSQIA